jgi:hypothetical protein
VTLACGARCRAIAAPNIPLPTIRKSTTTSFLSVLSPLSNRDENQRARRPCREVHAVPDDCMALPGRAESTPTMVSPYLR